MNRIQGILSSGKLGPLHEPAVQLVLRGAVGELSDLVESSAGAKAPGGKRPPKEETPAPTSGPSKAAAAAKKPPEPAGPPPRKTEEKETKVKEESDYSYETEFDEEEEDEEIKAEESKPDKGIPGGGSRAPQSTPAPRGTLGAAIGLKAAGKASAEPPKKFRARAVAPGREGRHHEGGASGSRGPSRAEARSASPPSDREPLARKQQKRKRRGSKGKAWRERGHQRKKERQQWERAAWHRRRERR